MDDTKERQATPEQLEKFLQIMDKTAPEEYVRTPISLGQSESGEDLGIIVWRKP